MPSRGPILLFLISCCINMSVYGKLTALLLMYCFLSTYNAFNYRLHPLYFNIYALSVFHTYRLAL